MNTRRSLLGMLAALPFFGLVPRASTPESRGFGPKNRVPGKLVWVEEKVESVRGKGGAGGEFVTYHYHYREGA